MNLPLPFTMRITGRLPLLTFMNAHNLLDLARSSLTRPFISRLGTSTFLDVSITALTITLAATLLIVRAIACGTAFLSMSVNAFLAFSMSSLIAISNLHPLQVVE